VNAAQILGSVFLGLASTAITVAAREVWRGARALRQAFEDVHATRLDADALCEQHGTWRRDPTWEPIELLLHRKSAL